MPRTTGSDNPEEFQNFLDRVPDRVRDVSKVLMDFAKKMTDMDVKIVIGASPAVGDACCLHNLGPDDHRSAAHIISEIARGLRDEGALPPNVLVFDRSQKEEEE